MRVVVIVVIVIVIVIVILIVTGGKQSQLLALALGLGWSLTIGKEFNEDIEVFAGYENSIVISRVYSIKFFCEYNMRWYPFDQQTCNIDLTMNGVLDNYADLLPGGVQFSGPKELT